MFQIQCNNTTCKKVFGNACIVPKSVLSISYYPPTQNFSCASELGHVNVASSHREPLCWRHLSKVKPALRFCLQYQHSLSIFLLRNDKVQVPKSAELKPKGYLLSFLLLPPLLSLTELSFMFPLFCKSILKHKIKLQKMRKLGRQCTTAYFGGIYCNHNHFHLM